MEKSILKNDSFVPYKNIKLNIKENNNFIKNGKSKKIYESYYGLKYQDCILDILEELREFDNKNGTCLFQNIIYNDLKSFILKSSF